MRERFCTAIRDIPDDISFEEQLRITKETGFDNIHVSADTSWEAYFTKEQLRDYVRRAKEYDLRVVNVHPPFAHNCEFWTPGPEHDKLVTQYADQIDVLSDCGVGSLIVHPTSGADNTYISEFGLETIGGLVRHAEQRGVILLMENLRSPIHLDYLFENIRSDNMRFCLDSGHENAFNHGIGFIRRYGSKLGFTHLHDNDGVGDQHRIPTDGTIDWAKLRADMEFVGYTGYINLEVFPFAKNYDGTDYKTFVKRAYDTLIQIFGE